MGQDNGNSNITFEHAVHNSAMLLARIDAKRIKDEEIANCVAELVQSLAGARGFFVTYLTDQSPTGEIHPEPILDGLSRSPEIVCDLIAKNLVMSSAMAVTHERDGDDTLAAGSVRVYTRCMSLAIRLKDNSLNTKLDAMMAALEAVLAKNNDGLDAELTLSEHSFGVGGKIDYELKTEYEQFLEKWKYDGGQLRGARTNVQTVLKQLKKTRN